MAEQASRIAALLLLSGCTAWTQVGYGPLYTDVKHPTHVVESEIPRQMRRGQSCSVNVFGLIAAGENGITAATLDPAR